MRNAVLASCAVALLVFGCSASKTSNAFGSGVGGDTGTSSSSTSSGLGGSFTGGGGAGGAGSSSSGDCSMAATLIYVLSEANDLYSFQPQQKAFKKIGPLQCATSMQPNSMAVDRNANAWVNYVESDPLNGDTAGSVFKVNTADASCQPTSIQLGQGWYRLGMGFSSDTSGGASETLFVAGTGTALGSGSPGLGRIDLAKGALTPIGPFSGSLNGQNAELTGTGDARLFGFFTTTPVQVAEIDKGSAMITSQKALGQVETPFAWAFSFWGGDFYLYTAPDPTLFPARTTNVTKYHPQDGSADPQYMVDIGFRIVGAGVSTCAPIEPPK